ncbi:MAG TPA: hypothetical protein VMW52_03845, partial [Phycisphaerae bacterium]|nr:hypothetical protein [Phycisphaerae bacterium]
AANEIIRRILNNEKDAQIYQDDPLQVIERRIRSIMRHRIQLMLTREQIARLQAARTEVLDLLGKEVAVGASMTGLQNALAGAGAQKSPPAATALEAPVGGGDALMATSPLAAAG